MINSANKLPQPWRNKGISMQHWTALAISGPHRPRTLNGSGLADEAPLSPEQQAWEEIRSLLLERDWSGAQQALQQQLEQPLTPPLQARVRFWLGLSAWELGETEQAQQIWQQLSERAPLRLLRLARQRTAAAGS